MIVAASNLLIPRHCSYSGPLREQSGLGTNINSGSLDNLEQEAYTRGYLWYRARIFFRQPEINVGTVFPGCCWGFSPTMSKNFPKEESWPKLSEPRGNTSIDTAISGRWSFFWRSLWSTRWLWSAYRSKISSSGLSTHFSPLLQLFWQW